MWVTEVRRLMELEVENSKLTSLPAMPRASGEERCQPFDLFRNAYGGGTECDDSILELRLRQVHRRGPLHQCNQLRIDFCRCDGDSASGLGLARQVKEILDRLGVGSGPADRDGFHIVGKHRIKFV